MAILFFWLICSPVFSQQEFIMTVNGPIPSTEMGKSLIHEHILVDFIGADLTGPDRWDQAEVIEIVLPFLEEIKNIGVNTLIECSPSYLGRDPVLLSQLSATTGIHLITNTGYYGAVDNKYLPKHAFEETADQLAQRWENEWDQGIDNSGIKPGFIKIGVNSGTLSDLHKKLITAAAITHLNTGLTIASHTGPAIPAFEQLLILEERGVSAEAFIWVHAQGEKNLSKHVEAARLGAWISLDGISENNYTDYLTMIKNLREEGLLHKVLISHDAGWFSPGEPNGGEFRPYTALFHNLLPTLMEYGFTEKEIEKLLVENPANAFQIKTRRKSS